MSIETFSDEVYDAIRAHMDANWTHTEIRWPNETYESPQEQPWIAFEIFGTVYGQESLGMQVQADNRWDQEGHIWFHIMVPQGSGSSSIRGAAKAIANLFRGLRLLNDDLEFRDASIGPGSADDDKGNWFRVSLSIQWRHWAA